MILVLFARYFIDFLLISLLGWLYESTLDTIKTGHFVNRGFLFGPICPIYGTGGIAVLAICENLPAVNQSTPYWEMFLIYAAGSAVLEYVTSWVMEKKFHARWWDYSKMPLNIQGRICLPATLLFGVMGIAGQKYLVPLIHNHRALLSPLACEGIAMLLTAFFAADTALSAAAASQLIRRMETTRDTFNNAVESGIVKVKEIPVKAAAEKDKLENAVDSAKEEITTTAAEAKEQLLNKLQQALPSQENHHLHNMKHFIDPDIEELAASLRKKKEAHFNEKRK